MLAGKSLRLQAVSGTCVYTLCVPSCAHTNTSVHLSYPQRGGKQGDGKRDQAFWWLFIWMLVSVLSRSKRNKVFQHHCRKPTSISCCCDKIGPRWLPSHTILDCAQVTILKQTMAHTGQHTHCVFMWSTKPNQKMVLKKAMVIVMKDECSFHGWIFIMEVLDFILMKSILFSM